MNYYQMHIKNFLLSREALSISKLEEIAGIKKDTLRHFLKGRRNLPVKYINDIEEVLIKYGYKPLNNE